MMKAEYGTRNSENPVVGTRARLSGLSVRERVAAAIGARLGYSGGSNEDEKAQRFASSSFEPSEYPSLAPFAAAFLTPRPLSLALVPTTGHFSLFLVPYSAFIIAI